MPRPRPAPTTAMSRDRQKSSMLATLPSAYSTHGTSAVTCETSFPTTPLESAYARRMDDEKRAAQIRRVKEAAEAAGLSSSDLARVMGVSPSVVLRRLSGQLPFKVSELILIAHACGVTSGSLVRVDQPLEVMGTPGKLAYSLNQAAGLVSVSADTLRLAVQRHELVASFVGRKALVTLEDLQSWLDRLPWEPPH